MLVTLVMVVAHEISSRKCIESLQEAVRFPRLTYETGDVLNCQVDNR